VDAVLRVDDEARIGLLRLVGVYDLIDARRAIESGRLAVEPNAHSQNFLDIYVVLQEVACRCK
jgi:hypothetical protein